MFVCFSSNKIYGWYKFYQNHRTSGSGSGICSCRGFYPRNVALLQVRGDGTGDKSEWYSLFSYPRHPVTECFQIRQECFKRFSLSCRSLFG